MQPWNDQFPPIEGNNTSIAGGLVLVGVLVGIFLGAFFAIVF